MFYYIKTEGWVHYNPSKIALLNIASSIMLDRPIWAASSMIRWFRINPGKTWVDLDRELKKHYKEFGTYVRLVPNGPGQFSLGCFENISTYKSHLREAGCKDEKSFIVYLESGPMPETNIATSTEYLPGNTSHNLLHGLVWIKDDHSSEDEQLK